MHETTAELVHPVILHGLRLQERIEAGQTPEIDTEQATLKSLLLRDHPLASWGGREPDLPGSADAEPFARPQTGVAERTVDVRYALVCWLDELFTRDTPWGTRWNEQKLEMELYGTNDRAWKFWEQARLAQARPGNDALEVFYLCVMLGFRGELRNKPDVLQNWTANACQRLGKVVDITWPYASEVERPIYVPPLHGRDRLRRMLMTGWVALLLLIPVMAFTVVHQLGR